MGKTGIANKLLNKPARILARLGYIYMAEKITFPTHEYVSNKFEIRTTQALLKSRKIQLVKKSEKQEKEEKAVKIIFPYSFFGPQNRKSRINEQRTLLKFLKILIDVFSNTNYSIKICNDNEKTKHSVPTLSISYHTHGAADKTLHYKVADLPDYVILDRLGYSGWSSLRKIDFSEISKIDAKKAEIWHRQSLEKIKLSGISKYAQKIEEKKQLPNKYVFVALQIPDDSTQEHANIEMLEMLKMVRDHFYRTDYSVVVKRHPLCTNERVEKALKSLCKDNSIILSDDSIHRLIESSSAVFTVNSGVGSEALTFMKPVYTFGDCDYEMVTHKIKNREDLKEKAAPPTLPTREENIKKFLYYYRKVYLIDCIDAIQAQKNIKNKIRGVIEDPDF